MAWEVATDRVTARTGQMDADGCCCCGGGGTVTVKAFKHGNLRATARRIFLPFQTKLCVVSVSMTESPSHVMF